MPTAQKVTDQAVDRSANGASPVWLSSAFEAVYALAKSTRTFTSDDVWDALARLGVEHPTEPRALGSVMREASKMGMIVPTGEWRLCTRVSRHRGPVRVWQSCVFTARS